ncbi:MAG: undecaprenyl-diphosphate phosphatase [Anaerolineae bacterium]
MDIALLLKTIVMGIVEGLTEFLPISSTGHLILAGSLLNFPERIRATFEIFIQLGAILAVVVFFWRDLLPLVQRALKGDAAARRLMIAVAIAFVPAAVVGVLASSAIKKILFGALPVSLAMIIGGVIMLAVENAIAKRQPSETGVENVSYKSALGVGVAQIAALWPGMSRSASTLVGGVLMGLDRATALRFSFYLAIPTLLIATIYDFVKSIKDIQGGDLPVFALGAAVAFAAALVVVKWFLGWVSHHDLKPFAWYRIVVGTVILVLVILGVGL